MTFDFKNLRILSFSAHPDDEIGGAGGFLLAAKNGGALLKLSLVIDPSEERSDASADEEKNIRLTEFKKVAKLLSADSSYLGIGRYPEIELTNIFPLIKEIRDFKPDLVLTPSDEEYHPDHRVVAALAKEAIWHAGRSAFPTLGRPYKAKTLLMYEADKPMSQVGFLYDISAVMEEKKKLINLYESQTARKNLADAMKGLNRFRGIMYKGGEYAEAFKTQEFFYG